MALSHFKVFWSCVHELCTTRGPYTAHNKAPDRAPTATLLKSNHMPSRRPCLIQIDLYVVIHVPIFDTRKTNEKSMKDIDKQIQTLDKCRKTFTKSTCQYAIHGVRFFLTIYLGSVYQSGWHFDVLRLMPATWHLL